MDGTVGNFPTLLFAPRMTSVPFFACLFLITLISGGLEASSIPNQYIVKLRNSANIQQTKKWIQSRAPMTASSLNKSIPLNETIKHTFTIGENYKGFSGVFSTSTLEALKNNPDVESITQDYMVHAFAEQKMNTPWGIERISERDFVEDRVYRYPDSAGNGVTVYVLDSGVDVQHQEFQNRAEWGFKTNAEYPYADDNGHGTAVAGVIAGYWYGVAKKANIVAIKVLDRNGAAALSSVMAGVAWMVDQVKAKRSPHVAVLSLGGPRNEQLNQVVEAAIANGANIVVASGNSNMNSCDVSPASARGAITVSSSDRNDFKDPTANFGSCVDVFAPGVAITTATLGQRSIILSGSSLAAAHVAGVASLYLSELGNLSPSELRRLIMENATKDRLKNVMGSPNLLVYNVPLVR